MPAIAIAAGIGAVGSIASAAIQSRAAGRAADTQENAANNALGLQRDIYNQTRADLAPYRDAGASAVGTLSGLMGLPMASSSGPMASTSGGVQPQRAPRQLPPGFDVNKPILPFGQSLADLAPRAAEAHQQNQSSYVRMRAPNGEEDDVPPQFVDEFLGRGAVRV